jgi:hypothetical protein
LKIMANMPPMMSPLITELMLVAAYGEGMVDRIDVVGPCAVFWRGPTKLQGGFRLKDHSGAGVRDTLTFNVRSPTFEENRIASASSRRIPER